MKLLAILLLPTTLTACLIADNFSDVWNSATPDACISELAPAFYEKSFKKTQYNYEGLVRPASFGDAHFVLVKEASDDNGGHLYPFFVDSGVLITKRGNPTQKDYAKKEYGKNGIVIKESTVTISKLDKAAIALLQEAYHDDRIWQEDLKMLYNKRLSDECRFEDRDLEAERE